MNWGYTGYRGPAYNPLGGEDALTKIEAYASEILSDRKYLVVLLKLGLGPKPSNALVGSEVYVVLNDGSVVRKRYAKTTMVRVLRRLVEAGLVTVGGGLDKRKKYYSLTPLGREVYDKVVEFLRAYVMHKAGDRGVIPARELERIAVYEVGVDPDLLREALDLDLEGEDMGEEAGGGYSPGW